jgi:hypothetical protein
VDARQLRGIGLLIGSMYALDLFSSYMSSPWSTEAFSEGDPTKAASARRLVAISCCTAVVVGATASWLDRNPWALIGASGSAAFMYYLYEDALQRAAVNSAAQPVQAAA